MKKVLLLFIVLAAVAGVIYLGFNRFLQHKKGIPANLAASQLDRTVHPLAPTVNPDTPPPLFSPGQWPKFREARAAAFTANPDLQAEYKGIIKDMNAEQAKIDAAMIKADPSVATVIAKLVVLRQRNHGPTAPAAGTASAQPAAPAPSVKLTQEDMQELRAARSLAQQSNPDLMNDSQKIAAQMRDFETKLNAAMVKADPTVSPLIAQFGNHQAPVAPAPVSGTK